MMLPQNAVDALPGQILTLDNLRTVRAVYVAAETDTVILAGSPGRRIVVVAADACCDDANTNATAVLIGLDDTTTPTATKVVLTHPGIPAGSGVLKIMGNGKPLEVGDPGHDLLITCSDPGGTLEVLIAYFLS